jgi:hypothetical protein
MSTVPGYALYFVGGPFDLTKRMYSGYSPKNPYIPMVEIELCDDISWETPFRSIIIGTPKNVFYKIQDGPHIVNNVITYIAYFQRADY